MIFEWTINVMSLFNQGQTMPVGRVFWFTGKVVRKEHYLFWYFVALTVVVVSGFMVRNLMRTRYGRCLVAVRDNDRAADAMGMHPGFTKVYAFALAGFFAGMAGALHAYLYRGAGIESFTLHQSISYLAMAIVGGLGTISGSFLGPAAIQLLDLQVEHLASWAASFMPAGMNLATALKPLSFGLVIVLFLIFEPRGIANWWRITRSYFKLWPFRY
jgi:branched-chain amino acid transport system permease protein